MKKINKGWKKWRIQKEELDEKNKVFIKLFLIENGKDLKIYETIIELNKSFFNGIIYYMYITYNLYSALESFVLRKNFNIAGGYFASLMVIILLLLYKY